MTVAVCGMGRFGAFWASLLTRECEVVAVNRSPRPVPEGVRAGSVSDLGSCDTVFLCTAISSLPEVLPWVAPHLSAGALLADTCSVKAWPVKMMLEHAPPGVDIMATHPMFGPDSARNGVSGLPIIVWPERVGTSRYQDWCQRFSRMGMVLHEMSPDQHDREAAFTQGITHFVGRLLGALDLKPSPIGTAGYRKLLEIIEHTCNDPWQLFLDLQHYNPHTAEMRARLKATLDELLDELSSRLDSKADQG